MEISTVRKAWPLAALVLAASVAAAGPILERAIGASAGESLGGTEALRQFAGGPPDRCVFAAPGVKLCAWEIEGRLLGSGADAASVGGRTNLVCELPVSAEAAAEPTCQAHAIAARPLPPVGASGSNAAALASRPRTLEALSSARTITDLSHRVGDVPERCYTGAGEQTCVWVVQPGSLAHERFASEGTSPALLRCSLPLDGSPRNAGSCTTARLPDATP